jgi:sorbitol-specific phosphotransferase system component IIC
MSVIGACRLDRELTGWFPALNPGDNVVWIRMSVTVLRFQFEGVAARIWLSSMPDTN